jgi:glucose-6-phosphate dehydrogenase assembly protein OpcA
MGDLAWTRLTRWRETLAQVFENATYLNLLPSVREVRVTFDSENQVAARYLGAWVVARLAAMGVKAPLAINPGEVFSLELQGEGLRVRLARSEDRLRLTVNALETCTNLPRPTDYLLLREELRIVAHDPAFETALASAAGLAYPTEK